MSPTASRRRTAATVAAIALLVTSALPTIVPGATATHEDADPEDWHVFTRVDATVVDNYATVNVTVEITEGGPDPEFPFAVRVPADAYVTGLEITRGNETYEAEVQPADLARAQYEEHRAEHGTAGLVEARDRTTYRYVVNVEEATEVSATLTYETYLAASNGTYTLPLEAPVSGFGTDRGAAFHVEVAHRDGVKDAWTDPAADRVAEENGTWTISERVGPRDAEDATQLDAHYAVEPTDRSGSLVTAIENGTGYFAHRFEADPGARDIPVDMTLVLDTSGSMGGLKIDQLRDAARRLVADLGPEDRLRLVPFSDSARPAWSGFRPADADNHTRALDEVDALVATGSTNVEDAIREGFAGHGEGGPEAAPNETGEALGIVVFLTDGQATAGVTDNDALRRQAREANDGSARVFGLAFGDGADWSLVHGLARDGGGSAQHVPEGQGAEVDLRRFMQALTAPVLRDVSVRYEGDVDPYHPSAPVLFAGSELLVVGTFDPALGNITGNVTAQGPDGPVEEDFRHLVDGEDGPGFLPDLVAYHRVRTLEDRVDAAAGEEGLAEEIRNLSLAHGLVTDYTSLVVTLPHQNETRQLCEDCEPRGDQHAEEAMHQGAGGGSGGSGGGNAGSGGGSGSTGKGAPVHDAGGGNGGPGSGPDAGSPSGGTSDGGAAGAPAGEPAHDASEPSQAEDPQAVPGPGLLAAAAAAVLAAGARRPSR